MSELVHGGILVSRANYSLSKVRDPTNCGSWRSASLTAIGLDL